MAMATNRFLKTQSFHAGVGIAIGTLAGWLASTRDWWQFASIAFAYASIMYLSAALLIGPLRVLRRGRPIVSSNTRRHLGVWSGIFAICHVGAALNVHFNGHIALYFFSTNNPDGTLYLLRNFFGISNDIGVVATALVVLLLAISNDTSIRKLGVSRWKRLQTLSYLIAAIVFIHAVVYQFLERRSVILVFIFVVVSVGVLAIQLYGAASVRRTNSGKVY